MACTAVCALKLNSVECGWHAYGQTIREDQIQHFSVEQTYRSLGKLNVHIFPLTVCTAQRAVFDRLLPGLRGLVHVRCYMDNCLTSWRQIYPFQCECCYALLQRIWNEDYLLIVCNLSIDDYYETCLRWFPLASIRIPLHLCTLTFYVTIRLFFKSSTATVWLTLNILSPTIATGLI